MSPEHQTHTEAAAEPGLERQEPGTLLPAPPLLAQETGSADLVYKV